MIIKIDISNASNTTCRALTLDVLSGYASRDYAYGLKQKEVIESTTCDGTGSPREGQKGGTPGDPLEMLIFHLTTRASTYGDVRLQSTRRKGRLLMMTMDTSKPR